jgi:hypothetical protein
MRLRVIVSWAGRRLPELKSQCHQKNPKQNKQSPNKDEPRWVVSLVNSTSILLKLFHEIESEGTLQNSFYEARVTLTRQGHEKKENCRSFFFFCSTGD